MSKLCRQRPRRRAFPTTVFTAEEHTTANLTAPRGYIITSAGDPSSAAQDLLSNIPVDSIPRLDEVAVAPKRVHFVASTIKRLTNWRAYFELLSSAPLFIKSKILTHSGHGSVSILISDIPHDRAIFASTAKATIRQITGRRA